LSDVVSSHLGGNPIKEALRITRLVTVFDIFDRTEDAVASFNKAGTAS
jgi:hypothetical protein